MMGIRSQRYERQLNEKGIEPGHLIRKHILLSNAVKKYSALYKHTSEICHQLTNTLSIMKETGDYSPVVYDRYESDLNFSTDQMYRYNDELSRYSSSIQQLEELFDMMLGKRYGDGGDSFSFF